MAARERKGRVFLYKHADFHTGGTTLQVALSKSLGKLKTIGKRRQPLAPDDESPVWRLVGQFREDNAFLFGILVQYAPGTNPTFLVDDEDATSIAVEQMAAPKTKDGKSREPLDGMLFFASTDNHMVLMQGSALRSMHLEQHLQWLAQKGGGIAGDNTFRLIDHPPKKVRNLLENQAVRELSIGGDLVASTPPERDEAEESATPRKGSRARQLVSSGDAGQGGIMDVLKGLLRPSEVARLNLDRLAGSNIEYTLQIRYRQETTESGHKFMDNLGTALRHAEGIETKIKLVGGGEIRGDDLKLSGPVRIEHLNGVPNPDHVFEEMRAWLLAKLKSGDVRAS
jgi:hypothetical protein